jgi:hypothetical protein
MFHGTPEEAQRMALLDKNQHVVCYIDAHRGEPTHRTGMEFGTRFEDGDYLWLPYSKDISDTSAFARYCAPKHELQILLLTARQAQKRIAELNAKTIPAVYLHQVFYLPLRFFGENFYDSFQDLFKDAYSQDYYYKAVYTDYHDLSRRKIKVTVPERNLKLVLNGAQFTMYGQQQELPRHAILVDRDFLKNNPAVLRL